MNELREFDNRSRHFPLGDHFINSQQRDRTNCPLYRGVRIIEVAEESMIFGISGTKRTVRYRGVRKERLDCTRFFR